MQVSFQPRLFFEPADRDEIRQRWLLGVGCGGAVPIGVLAISARESRRFFVVEGVGEGSFGGEFDHPVPAGIVGGLTFGVVPGEESGLFDIVPAGVGGGV